MLNLRENETSDYDDITLLINYPILVTAHEHPLLLCTCKRNNKGWSCDECKLSFSQNTPSFYCTYCDYDLCKKCLGNYKLNQIKPFNEYLNSCDIKVDNLNQSYPWQQKFPNHEHSLSLINKTNNKSKWKCQKCGKVYKKNINILFYCSLCDYNICYKCKNSPKMAPKMTLIFGNEDSCSDCSRPDDSSCIYKPGRYFPTHSVEKRKPVIYLYPQKEMDISVQMNIDLLTSKFTTVYPKFNEENNIWKVHAKPNGDIILLDKKDKIYPYLFWESKSYEICEMNEGFIVKDIDAEKFLEEKLKILGLNDKESTDFITYWLPVLLKNKLSLCSFQTENFFNKMKLNVSPKPDTMIRIFLAIKKIESPMDIKEQKLEPNERKGYTVIEWGGTELNS